MQHSDPQFTLFKRFWRLAVVNIISNLMVPLASLVDLAFLGHLADIQPLAGVAIATILFNYIYWTFGFLRMGTTGLTAQAQGKGEEQEIILTLLRNGAIALGISLLILLLQQPIKEIGFFLLQADPAVIASGQAYYDALIWGAPATLINFVLWGWFLGQEKGLVILLFSLVSKGANIGFDYLFIVKGNYASAGAGAATAISQWLTLFLGLVLAYRELSGRFPCLQRNQLVEQLWDATALKSIFTLNHNLMIRTLALVSTFAVFTNLSALINTEILASNTLLLQVVTLAAYFIDGLAFATESLVGNFQGQGAISRLKPLLKLASSISLLAGLSFAMGFIAMPRTLFGLLTNHRTIIDQVQNYVWWLCPVLGFASLAYLLDGYFLGLTAGAILRQSTLLAALIGFAPLAIAAWYWQANHLLWLALTLFMAARTLSLARQINFDVNRYNPN